LPNRLADETSPYLLQHAHNPVDWYPWGPEALERAQAERKPILLSVGYSACHWCHVMERESFENEGIAATMNEHFVCIKVDREERPDVDELYMKAVQAFQHGRGGWPMTVFLTPEGEPFFGGTYYPPTSRNGVPGFDDILGRMATMWADRPDQIHELTSRVRGMLADVTGLPDANPDAPASWLAPVVKGVLGRLDKVHGGFVGAPKFPPHGALSALYAYGRTWGDEPSLDAFLLTLDRIAQGGMYDLLGGGFARYSVDEVWRVPHFEKMLYDNAQLLVSYTQAHHLTGASRFEAVVRNTVRWLLEDMRLEHGGFAASLDADSEGPDGTTAEGLFYTWTAAELAEVLDASDTERLATLLGVSVDGSFEDGRSVLRLERPMNRLDRRERALVERCLPRLFRVRSRRKAPARDDKVVTAWNGLAVRALAIAGAAFGEPTWIEAAGACARFLLDEVTVDGRLMRTYKDGRAHIPGFADDYAALLLGLVDLYEASHDPAWLQAASGLGESLHELFAAEGGGLHTTGKDQPDLIVRSMPGLAGAEPSANGLAALALARLATLLDRAELGERADTILARLRPYLDDVPVALGLEAVAGAHRVARPITVVISGPAPARDALVAEARRELPYHHALVVADDGEAARLFWTEGKDPIHDQPAAYVCVGTSCQLPTTDPLELRDQLRAHGRNPRARAVPAGERTPGPALPVHPRRWVQSTTPLGADRLRGQIVVLQLFAASDVRSWPSLGPELDRTFVDDPVVVVSVASPRYPGDAEPRMVAGVAGRHELVHPMLLDEDHDVQKGLGLTSVPATAVLDGEGRIAWVHEGPLLGPGPVIDIVRTLLAEGNLDAPLPEPERTQLPAGDLSFPSRIHVWPDAMMQELGANALRGGTLYIADSGNHRIVELSIAEGSDGWPRFELLRSFGGPTPGFADGPEMRFERPHGLCRSENLLYVADSGNHALRRIDLEDGTATTLMGTGHPPVHTPRGRQPWSAPETIAVHTPIDIEVMSMKGEDLVYVALAGQHQLWVWAEGHSGRFAGNGALDHVDGPAVEASLAQPSGVVTFGRYLLFIDSATHSLRAIDLQHHQAVTVTGLGPDDHGDVDGHGETVRMQYPTDLTFIGETLYVTDALNHKVKSVTLATIEVTTVAGGDDHAFARPTGIDRIGRFLVVADSDNHRVRILDPASGEVRDLEWSEPS